MLIRLSGGTCVLDVGAQMLLFSYYVPSHVFINSELAFSVTAVPTAMSILY